jgi:hypothetical protein
MVDRGRQSDPRQHLLAPGKAKIFPEVLKDKQRGAVLELLHDLGRVSLRRGPEERVEMLWHKDVSYNLESQLPPQVAQSRNPVVPETLGIK